MAKIQTYTDAIHAGQAILYSKADEIRGWITEHNNMVVEWKGLAEKFIAADNAWTTTHNNMTTTCCAKDNAAVIDVAYLEPSHSCDFKAADADKCIEKTRDSVDGYVNPYFVEGQTHYHELVRNCDFLGNLTVAKHKAFDIANENCDSKEIATRAKADLIGTETTKFVHNWETLREGYRANVTIMEEVYNGFQATVEHDTADRKNEWTSTQVIKCMLIAFKEGGGFDQATLTTCQGKTGDTAHLVIKYPEMVERIQWVLEPFVELSDYEHDTTCHKNVEQANPECEVAPQKAEPQCTNHMG
jgi:hypothetical protein